MTSHAPAGASRKARPAPWRMAWAWLGPSQFLRFACVGTVGFAVDGGILTSLMRLGWEPLPARLISFSVAVVITWLINKAWTFGPTAPSARGGGMRYAGVQIIGALINLAIFTLLMAAFPVLRQVPWVPLAMAALVALVFNYLATRHLVFTPPET
jgi:putative flippase GtrA